MISEKDVSAPCSCAAAGFCPRYGGNVTPRVHELCAARPDYRPVIAAKYGVAPLPEPLPKPVPASLLCRHRSREPIAKEPCLPCPSGKKPLVDVYACDSPAVKATRCTIAKGREVANAVPCEFCGKHEFPPMDAVYFFRHSQHGDEELRYSLRSVARFAPWLRRIYVLGDRPAWLADSERVVHVPWETVAKPFGFRTPIVNGFAMRVAATAIEGLSDEWLMFSDDYVLLRPFSPADARVDRSFGELSDKPPAETEKNLRYRKFIWKTRETLRELGYPTQHFDIHVPVRLTNRRVLDAFRDFEAYRSEDRLGGLTNDVAILNHAMKAEGFKPARLRQWVDRVTWYGERPKSAEEVREKCDGPWCLNFDDDAYGPEISGYLAERFPTPASWERRDDGTPAPKPLHVHVVQGAGWIIERVAKAICAERTTVSRVPDPSAEVNFYVHYRAMREPVPRTLNVVWMTHLDPTEARRREWARIVEQADLCLAMCEKTAALCPPEKTQIWAGAPDAAFVKRTIRIGVAMMPGPRKGLEKLDAIRGIPGVEIVQTDGKMPLADLPAWFRSIDYLLVTSDLEGGPFSVKEAIAAGKPVIAPDVGWCWEHRAAIRYDGTAEDLAALVRTLRYPPDPWAESSRELEAILRDAIERREKNAATFDPGDGSRLPYFVHPYNCGTDLTKRRTERTVELPIADRWLSSVDPADVVEIGAVTPYYWPGRIARVVDPSDPKATERTSLFDVDLTGCDVLSISTIEHVGERAYGLAEDRTPLEALQKIVAESRRFLVTFPCGWHTDGAKELEAFVLGRPEGLSVRILTRGGDERWSEGEPLPYGVRLSPWANAVVVIERSGDPETRSHV